MSITLDLSKFANLSEDKLKAVVSKTAIDLGQAVIADTPVDSGRLKGNWMPAVNGYDNSTTEATDKGGDSTSARVEAKFSWYKVGDTLTMSNNLPYAYPIEFLGHSKIKAPRGMVRINVLKFQKFVNKNARAVQ